MDTSAPSQISELQNSSAVIFGGTPEKRQKSPGAAFGMSLLLPGSGQLYCGKKRGITTMIFFFVGVAICIGSFVAGSPNEMVLGFGIRLSIILYAFGFLDAYYTAREVNRDIDLQIDGSNPRVAAVLNLLTKGFGYFYLGLRKAGIGVFVLVTALDGAIRQGSPEVRLYMGVIGEIVLALLALHAWRMARKEVEPLLVHGEASVAANPPRELGKGLPICLAFFVGSIYMALVVIGLMMGANNFSHIDPSTGKVNTVASGAYEYVNSKYGVTAKFPTAWTVVPGGDAQSFFEAKKTDACNVMLIAEQELFHRPDDEVLLAELRKKYPQTKLAGMNASKLGEWPANEVQLRIPIGETEVLQRYIVARRGFSAYVLIETLGLDECREDMEYIRENVMIQK